MKIYDKMKEETYIDDKYINKLNNITFDPVFILGLHRSGTSILYKMLGQTNQFNILTAYHILNYDELLYIHENNLEKKKTDEINNLFISKGITNRKTDNMEVTANYAHEYMYVFLKRNYPWKINLKNKHLFDELCKKLKYISDKNYYVLLKNPHDFSNFIYIKKLYPNAKFIFIHRNPIHVISSVMRLWHTNLKNKNEYLALFSKKYDQLFNNPFYLFLTRFYYTSHFPIGTLETIYASSKETKYYLKNIKYLSENDYISIKYEDLCKKPNKTISDVMNFLHLESNKDFGSEIKPRNLDLIPEVRFFSKFIFKKMKSYFEYCDYLI